jgi:hypothetical protein
MVAEKRLALAEAQTATAMVAMKGVMAKTSPGTYCAYTRSGFAGTGEGYRSDLR